MGKSREFLVRSISGLVFVSIFVGGTLLSASVFTGLICAITVGCISEFLNIAKKSGFSPQYRVAQTMGFLIIILNSGIATGVIPAQYICSIVPMLLVVTIVELYRKKANPIGNIGVTIASVIYVATSLSMLIYLAQTPTSYRPWIVLGVVLIVWANDVGAYLVGISIGKHRLMERISPKKSWEGFFGGVIFAIAVAMVMGHFLNSNIVVWAGAGFVTAIIGVLGDLVESMFKRSAEIKDSGNLIPGHGGLLDRFDALILASPFVFLYFTIFNL